MQPVVIAQYEKELEGLYGDRVGNRMEIYVREGKISRRKEFVDKLEQILEYRNKEKK